MSTHMSMHMSMHMPMHMSTHMSTKKTNQALCLELFDEGAVVALANEVGCDESGTAVHLYT